MMNSSCYSHQGLCISSSGPRPTLVFESDDDCYDDHHFIISSSMSIPNVSDDHSYISYIVTSCSWYIRLYWYRYLNIDDSFQIIMIWWWWWCWWSRRRWAGRQTWIPPRGCNRRSCSPTSMDCSPWILPMTRRLSCRNVPFDKPVLGQYPMTEPNKTAIVTNNPSGIELFFYFQRYEDKPTTCSKKYSCLTRAISINFPHHWNIEIRTMPTTTWLNLQLQCWNPKSLLVQFSKNRIFTVHVGMGQIQIWS